MNEPMEEPAEPKSMLNLKGDLSLSQDGDGDYWIRIGEYPIQLYIQSQELWEAVDAYYHAGTPLGDRIQAAREKGISPYDDACNVKDTKEG